MSSITERGARDVPERTVERAEGPQNTFVEFIAGNQDSLDRFSSLSRELAEEQKGWRSSPTFENLTKRGMDFALGNSSTYIKDSGRKQMNERARRLFRNNLSTHVFQSDYPQGNRYLQADLAKFSREQPSLVEGFESWTDDVGEFSDNYWGAIKDVSTDLDETETEAFTKFADHLGSRYENLTGFVDFLTAPQHKAEREGVRRFLVRTSEKVTAQNTKDAPETFLDAIGKRHIARAKTDISEKNPLFSDFVKDFLTHGGEEADWLVYATRRAYADIEDSDAQIDISSQVYSMLKATATEWPQSLRDAYDKYVLGQIARTNQALRQELSTFRQVVSTEGFDLQELMPQKEKKGSKHQKRFTPKQTKATGNDTPVEKEKTLYKIGAVQVEGEERRIRESSDEEIEELLSKTAKKSAGGNVGFKNDLRAMINSLKKSPYGLGTKVLKASKIVLNGNQYRLRSFNPDKRTEDIPFEHDESRRFRMVYTLAPQDSGGTTVVLIGIHHHDDFDDIYAGG